MDGGRELGRRGGDDGAGRPPSLARPRRRIDAREGEEAAIAEPKVPGLLALPPRHRLPLVEAVRGDEATGVLEGVAEHGARGPRPRARVEGGGPAVARPEGAQPPARG